MGIGYWVLGIGYPPFTGLITGKKSKAAREWSRAQRQTQAASEPFSSEPEMQLTRRSTPAIKDGLVRLRTAHVCGRTALTLQIMYLCTAPVEKLAPRCTDIQREMM